MKTIKEVVKTYDKMGFRTWCSFVDGKMYYYACGQFDNTICLGVKYTANGNVIENIYAEC